jgi:hypothetical protein
MADSIFGQKNSPFEDKNGDEYYERERERERARNVPSGLNLAFLCIIFIMLGLFYGIIGGLSTAFSARFCLRHYTAIPFTQGSHQKIAIAVHCVNHPS